MPHSSVAKRGGHGFSLVELLVVLAILGVILSVVVPSFDRATALGRRTHCTANLKHLSEAFQTQRAQVAFGGSHPYSVADQWPLHLKPFLDNNVFSLQCLDDSDPEPYFPQIDLRREAYAPLGHPEWDLHLFTTEPVWEEYSLAEWEGNPPGVQV